MTRLRKRLSIQLRDNEGEYGMSTLSYLREQLREKEKELKIYEKRLRQLESILSNLSSDFDDDVEDINSYIDSLISTSEEGFVDYIHIQDLNTEINADKEKSVSLDGDLSEARSNLESDKSKTSEMIETIKAEIASLERRIAEEEERERREREAQAREALNALKNLL